MLLARASRAFSLGAGLRCERDALLICADLRSDRAKIARQRRAHPVCTRAGQHPELAPRADPESGPRRDRARRVRNLHRNAAWLRLVRVRANALRALLAA